MKKRRIHRLAAFMLSMMLLAACGKQDMGSAEPEAKAVNASASAVTETSSESTADAVTELSSSADSAADAAKKDKKKQDSDSSEAEKEAEPLYVIESHGPRPYDGAAAYDDFADAAFIGDSRTVGLMLNGDKPQADYFASAGLNVITIQETPVVSSSMFTDEELAAAFPPTGDEDEDEESTTSAADTMLVPDAVKVRKYKRIFLNFGINEMGWPYPETFVEKYELLISQVRSAQPNATIYVESMLPVSYQALEINSCFNAKAVDAFNEDYIRRVALETGCVYMDVNRFFRDSRGDLYYGAAGDGIHMIRAYCLEWMDVLAYYTTGSGNLIEISYNLGSPHDDETPTVNLGDDGLPEVVIPDSLPDQIIPDMGSSEDSSSEDSSEYQEDSSESYYGDDTYSYDDGYYDDHDYYY